MTRELRLRSEGWAEDAGRVPMREGAKLPTDRARQMLEILAADDADFRTLAKIAGYDPARDFIGADLRGVDFGEDDLSGFVFRGADVVGANLAWAKGVTTSMLAGATFDATTKFPDDIEEYLNERAKSSEFWKAGAAPSFVSAFGVDEFGQWFEFAVPGAVGAVKQRMRWMAAGTFMMGSPDNELGRTDDEGLQREVTISEGFWMFDTACPQRLWREVMDGGNPSLFEGDDHPVERVSWDDVQEFLRRIEELAPGLRLALPSEEQWEYACRAGTSTRFSFGETITPKQVNYNVRFPYSSAQKTVPVGSLPPNLWGLHEMHGNVSEWCAAMYRNNAAVNAFGRVQKNKATVRILRGGSWLHNARDVRSASRIAFAVDEDLGDIGFRCARVQDGAEPAETQRARRSGPPGGVGRARWREEGDDGARTFPVAEVFAVHSDRGRASAELLTCPLWAAAIGQDRYGIWVRIEVPGSDGPVAQRMRWINPGRFLMGSPDYEADRLDSEGPRHEVTIANGIWLFETACSQALWTAVMGENPSRFDSADRPVECVSWWDAQAFIAAINARMTGLQLSLPSEAQWEYACRAGTMKPFGFGETITSEQVNYDGNFPYGSAPKGLYRRETVQVGSLPANRWGLYEMHGNVWEWCADAWHENYEGAPADGSVWERSGRDTKRVMRGGSWSSDAQDVRSAFRLAYAQNECRDNFGFRCVRIQD